MRSTLIAGLMVLALAGCADSDFATGNLDPGVGPSQAYLDSVQKQYQDNWRVAHPTPSDVAAFRACALDDTCYRDMLLMNAITGLYY